MSAASPRKLANFAVSCTRSHEARPLELSLIARVTVASRTTQKCRPCTCWQKPQCAIRSAESRVLSTTASTTHPEFGMRG